MSKEKLPEYLFAFDQGNKKVLVCNLCGKVVSTDKKVIKESARSLILCKKCSDILLKEAEKLKKKGGE